VLQRQQASSRPSCSQHKILGTKEVSTSIIARRLSLFGSTAVLHPFFLCRYKQQGSQQGVICAYKKSLQLQRLLFPDENRLVTSDSPLSSSIALDMSDEFTVTTCPDYNKCYHGGRCVESPKDENFYYCDCTTAKEGTVYAGVSCEHEATSFCNPTSEVNYVSFCTNQGKCVETGEDQGLHAGCECPTGYSGQVSGGYGMRFVA
jgi:EGF-like domain